MCSLPGHPESHFSCNASSVLEATDSAAIKGHQAIECPHLLLLKNESATSSSRHSSKCASHPCPPELHNLPGAASANVCPPSESSCGGQAGCPWATWLVRCPGPSTHGPSQRPARRWPPPGLVSRLQAPTVPGAAAAPPLAKCGPGPRGPESLRPAATSGLGLPRDQCQPHARYHPILGNLNFSTSDDCACLERVFDVEVEEIRCQLPTVTSFLQLSNHSGGKKQRDFFNIVLYELNTI